MAPDILAAPRLSRNYVLRLTQVLEITFKYLNLRPCGFTRFNSLQKELIFALKTLIKLGHTTVKVSNSNSFSIIYSNYETTFLHCCRLELVDGDFCFMPISITAAKTVNIMIRITRNSYRKTGYANNYPVFAKAVAKLIDNVVVQDAGLARNAAKLREILLTKM